MKKLNDNYVEWLERQQRISNKNSLRLASIRKIRGAAGRTRRATCIIKVPRHLLAEKEAQRKEIVRMLLTARAALSKPGVRVRFDFSDTKQMFPGGTLMLLAHLELLLQKYRARVSARCPPNSLAAQLMRHFGVADKLGISPEISRPNDESVVNWRYRTGTHADGSAISDLLEEYKSLTKAEIPEGLYDVLAEALTNVRHHAYPEGVEIPEGLKKWWLFSRYVEPSVGNRGNLYIGIYDVGTGVQNSLKSKLSSKEIVLDATDELFGWTGWKGSKKSLEKLLLQRAVERRRSRTGLSFRGNGFPEMRDFVLQTNSGRLYIISGHAQYSCVAESQLSSCVSCDDFEAGTLILWSIPLYSKKDFQ